MTYNTSLPKIREFQVNDNVIIKQKWFRHGNLKPTKGIIIEIEDILSKFCYVVEFNNESGLKTKSHYSAEELNLCPQCPENLKQEIHNKNN